MVGSRLLSLGSLVGLSCLAASAFGQTAPTPQAPTETVTPAAAVATPAPPPSAAPAAVAPMVAIPPGYALVPTGNPAQTYYQVQYPQAQGALPPGMEMPYESGDPIPDGYRVVSESRRGLVIAGAVVGGVSYGLSVMEATQYNFDHKSGSLLVPVAGPWIMLALGGAKDRDVTETYGSTSYSNREDNSFLRAVLVADGMAQAAGAAMLIAGIAYPKKRLVRKDVAVSVAPMRFGKDGYGFAATGQF